MCRALAQEVGETVNLAECLTPPLARFTGRTITAAADFSRLLAEVRRQGYATAVEELEAGLTALAAPVRNVEGVVVASISASGPSFRIPADRIPILGRLGPPRGGRGLPPPGLDRRLARPATSLASSIRAGIRP